MAGRNRVFADSNYFVAIFNTDDSLYRKAQEIARKIADEKIQLVISNFIFLEIVTIVSQKKGRAAAIQAGRDILSHPFLVDILHIDEALQKDTWNIFQEVEHKNISFVDCSIVAAMKSEGIQKLLTFDAADFTKLQNQHRFSFYG